jgi:hypothetical protein
VVIADDGVGLPEGATWPKPGKLSALILRSLQQNARASIDIQSAPGEGMRVTINFTCDDAAPHPEEATVSPRPRSRPAAATPTSGS